MDPSTPLGYDQTHHLKIIIGTLYQGPHDSKGGGGEETKKKESYHSSLINL
jgi:hypothetical protein